MKEQTLPSRRSFLKTGAALSGAALPGLSSAGLFVSGSDVLRVGLIGCGGRGSGAAKQALLADDNAVLTALGDAFENRLDRSLKGLQSNSKLAGRVDVPPERCFTGFDAYQKVLESGVDVVILATPPHFRPVHLKAAVDKGVHVFCEKPVAVDAPGVRSVRETCAAAKKKNLSIVSGLCYRYHDGRRAIIEQIHGGRIGDITALEVDYNTGGLWSHKRQPAWSDMEWQMRNWLYFTWLSGDHIAEQHIHSLDVMCWALGDQVPVKAVSLGGRQARTSPDFGNVYDHFATIYTFANGVKGHSYCRQQVGCKTEVNDYVVGSKGRANVFRHQITGEDPWAFGRKRVDMYQNEHDELFASIRDGKPINNGEYMCNSTLVAIMGRMAAYTGQEITWDQAVGSQQDLTPVAYEWGDIEVAPVAVPGITKFS